MLKMTYEQTLDYLYNQMPEYQRIGHSAYKPGLDNSFRLDEIFDQPHQKFKTIHVGGTNGKGSTSHLLAAILQKSGYKTGLYTSPHLIDFRERIRINGEMISETFVIDFVEKFKAQFEPVMPSFFELTMEMAFLYFAMQKVDVAVIEVGLGGRLDSTNIISPDLSVITNIGLDHTQYLGDTLTQIASEKAGIIKPGTPVVIGEAGDGEIKQVFVEKAAEVHAPIFFAEEATTGFKATKTNSGWHFSSDQFPEIDSVLGGFAQEKNAKTVLTAVGELRKLGYEIPDQAVVDGFRQVTELTGLQGRWQTLQENPKIVCDTGHNAHAVQYIVEQLSKENYNQLHIVFGMVNDKDIDAVLKLLPQDAHYYFTKASIKRAIDERDLALKAAAFDLKGTCFENVESAIKSAKENADKNDLIFIGGSSFIVADALPLFVKLPD